METNVIGKPFECTCNGPIDPDSGLHADTANCLLHNRIGKLTQRSLVKKLCRIMKAVGYLQKTGKNAAQNYKYATEADVAEMMREKLADENVFIFPNVVRNERTRIERLGYKEGEVKVSYATDVEIEWTFEDGDSGETRVCRIPGSSETPGDKGVYVAQTGSEKYLLMKSFLIPTGDDPESDDNEPRGSKEAAQEVAQRKITEANERKAANTGTEAHSGSNGQQQASSGLVQGVGTIQVSSEDEGTFRLTPSWTITDKEAIKRALTPFTALMLNVNAVFLPNGKCYVVEKEHVFSLTDALHQIGWKIVQANERTLEKLPPPADFVNATIDKVGGLVATKDGKKSFFDVTLGGEVVRCFDKGLQPVFAAELGKEACVKIKPGKGNYGPTLAGALSVGTADLEAIRNKD